MPRIYNLHKLRDRRRWLRRNATKAESVLWQQLRGRRFGGLKFRRQHSVGSFILDFFCPELRLGIEVDGDSHFELDQQAYDRSRTIYLESMYVRIIRFRNDEVLRDLEGVLERLRNETTTLNPSSR